MLSRFDRRMSNMTNREKVDYINSRLKPEDVLQLLAEAAENASSRAKRSRAAIMANDLWSMTSIEDSYWLRVEAKYVHLYWSIFDQCSTKADVIPWETSLSARESKMLDDLIKNMQKADKKFVELVAKRLQEAEEQSAGGDMIC